MKHELLVPVGNYKSLIAAINNGADAVYLAGKKYGARAYSENFTLEELKNAIDLAHLYNVKVFITVNTLIYESEIQEAIEYIEEIHKMGVDAVIMQDVGLIKLTREIFPNLEIHASTQMHNFSIENVKYLESLGVKRIVFARELSLENINSFETKLDKEVFIHGSLCICYSGQCYYSKCILNRSANRGECAGMCRLKYEITENNNKLTTNGEYLLSPKDLCSIEKFKDLMDSNILSFKIEGRMKSPEYVGIVTKIYHKLINQYEQNEELKVSSEDEKILKKIFYREYTKGLLFNEKDIINSNSSNHIGLYAGKVIEVNSKKVKILLNETIHQGDSIRFKKADKGITLNFIYDIKDNLISNGTAGEIIYLDNFMDLKNKDDIYITNSVYKELDYVTKKIEIDMNFSAHLGENIKLKISDGKNTVIVEKEPPQIAITRASSTSDIEKAIKKTGNTPYIIKNIDINIDNNLFIRNILLNELRREGLEKLGKLRCMPKIEFQKNKYEEQQNYEEPLSGIYVLARTKEQIDILKKYDVKIIVDNEKMYEKDFIFKIPRNDINKIYDYKNYLITSYASMNIYKNQISDYYLNITNHYALSEAFKYNKIVTLSIENDLEQNKEIIEKCNNKNAAIFIYGRIELMIIKNCIIKSSKNEKKCTACLKNNIYKLFKIKFNIIN